MKIVVGLFICTALLAPAQEPVNGPAFKNSGFEKGLKKPDSWTVSGDGPDLKVSWTVETNRPHSGERSLQLKADGYAGSVSLASEKVSVTSGYYLVRFWAKIESDSGNSQFKTRIIPAKSKFPNDKPAQVTVNDRLEIPADGTWRAVDSLVVIRNGEDQLQINFDCRLTSKNSLSIRLDDFEIIPTNESCYRFEAPLTEVLPPIEPAYQVLSTRTQAHGTVSPLDDRPRMMIDGQPVPPTYYTTFAQYQSISTNASKLVPPITDFKNAKVNIYSPMINLSKVQGFWF